MYPTVSCVWLSRFSKPTDVRFDPPSEDEMAAWLCTIVNGDEPACNDDGGSGRLAADDGQEDGVSVMETSTTTTDKKEKAPTTTTVEGMMIMGNKVRT
jgi:hypothetical protein